jgi:hypothetical protein
MSHFVIVNHAFNNLNLKFINFALLITGIIADVMH